MKFVSIAERLRPFSHRPGTRCLIPGTDYLVEAFPALIRVLHVSGELMQEHPLEITGPLKLFTLMQDLERGCVTLFSESYRYHLLPNLTLVTTKNPGLEPLGAMELFSLGNHKNQDWDLMRRRCDFREILPLWFRLGSFITLPKRSSSDEGMFELLSQIRDTIVNKQHDQILAAFEKLFLAGFGSLMVPRLQDTEHQGILKHEGNLSENPLYLLKEGADLIRSMFFQAEKKEIFVLPHLPPQCFSGRFLHLKTPFGEVDLEWSKKTIRRLWIRATSDAQLNVHFQTGLKQFRLRTSEQERGFVIACGDSLEIKSGIHYLLDQFQK